MIDSRLRVATLLTCVVCIVGWDFEESVSGQELPKAAWTTVRPKASVSYRGLCVTPDGSQWVSGSLGTVMKSHGGNSWKEVSPLNFEKLDFRSIHAWDDQNACIASAGQPAIILRTEDGGLHWREVFRHDDPQAFFDALHFSDANHGLCISDPLNGIWLLVESNDQGRSWKVMDTKESPRASEGEAAFAASNGSWVFTGRGQGALATGGDVDGGMARIHVRDADGKWSRWTAPIRSNKSSGIFAIAFGPHLGWIAVGGDYMRADDGRSSAVWSRDGILWNEAKIQPSGYRSSLAMVESSLGPLVLAIGPSGGDGSRDGSSWARWSDEGFHVIRWDASARRVWAAGSDGRIAFTAVP